MGYALCFGSCVVCRKTFSFNPMRVPSMQIAGSREPVCKECMDLLNQRLVANGHAPVAVLPGAYEACDEAELEDAC